MKIKFDYTFRWTLTLIMSDIFKIFILTVRMRNRDYIMKCVGDGKIGVISSMILPIPGI